MKIKEFQRKMNLLIDIRKEGFVLKQEWLDMITKAIEATLAYLDDSQSYEISLSFVTNEEIQALNCDYRGVDAVTDVLSFPMEDEFGIEQEDIMLGDIVIATDKIQEQAIEYEHSFERELAYLVVHSMLHLMGFDHLTEEDKNEMRQAEKTIMDVLQIYRS